MPPPVVNGLRGVVFSFETAGSTEFRETLKNVLGKGESINRDQANRIISLLNPPIDYADKKAVEAQGRALDKALDDAKALVVALNLYRTQIDTESCPAELLADGATSQGCKQVADRTIKMAKYIANELAYCKWAMNSSLVRFWKPSLEVPFKESAGQ
jgi:hypothetical protein